MAKTKMRNKAYRPKPVHRIPPILIGIEASTDRLNKLTAVARNALLKLHYEAAEEGDYLILQVVKRSLKAQKRSRHFS